MALPFRQRIFVVLVALTAVPTALAVVGWALPVRPVGPWGARVRGAAPGAARARDGARRGARARARGRAATGIPGGGPPRGPRDQEPAHIDADRGGPARTDGRTGGQPDRDGRRGAGRRDPTVGATRKGVLRLRSPAGGTEERGRPRGPVAGPGEERRASRGRRAGTSQR